VRISVRRECEVEGGVIGVEGGTRGGYACKGLGWARSERWVGWGGGRGMSWWGKDAEWEWEGWMGLLMGDI
jgi:hypothetical protein